ncbi:MAG: response regulator [Myxococcales bacterium]|nr:response regulator [Myxococcales bacterium]
MESILVIDDDVGSRSILRIILENRGYRVLEATDGRDAEPHLREDPPHLVITDVLMPEKDGFEILLDLRRRCPGTRVIVVSGGGKVDSAQYLELAHQLGADRTFAKPFKVEELLQAVQELLT